MRKTETVHESTGSLKGYSITAPLRILEVEAVTFLDVERLFSF